MNNDQAEVDELIIEIAHYKNDLAIWLPKNFCGSARPAGKRINTCKTACTMDGFHDNRANL